MISFLWRHQTRKHRYMLISVLVCALMAPAITQEEGKEANETEMVNVNFDEGIALEELISLVSDMTAKRFQYEPSVVQGKVVVVSKEKIPKSSLFSFFLDILKSKNLTVVKEGSKKNGQEIWKIKKANQQGAFNRVVKGELPDNAQIISKVFHLEHINVSQARKMIRKLLTDGSGSVMGIRSVNAVLVTDYASSIQQISKMIELMDKPTKPPRTEIVNLSHISPSRAQETMSTLLPGIIQKGETKNAQRQAMLQQTQILVHPSNDALIIMASSRHMNKILSLVQKLDKRGKQKPSTVHTFQLNNTDAKQIASKVQSLFEQKIEAQEGPGGQAENQEHHLTIKPIESQNSLVINAPDSVWKNQIRPLLERIDTKRSQVLISATIVEVTGEIRTDIGVDITSISQSSDQGVALSTVGITGDLLADTNGDGIPDSLRPSGSTGGTILGRFLQDRQEIFVLTRLFREDQIINVSQLPYMVARDNQEASLSVKNEVPFQETTSLQGGQTQQNVQFEEAGLELTITPQITDANYLRMDVLAKFNEFQGQSSETLPPQKTVRELETALTVPNRNTVVMGGLSSRVKDDTDTGIPYLKEIPYAGQLFRRDEATNRKTTLYLFITPYILRDRRFREYRGISRKKKQGAQKLTGLDFGENDSMVGPSGSLDYINLDTAYSEETRNRVLNKYTNLFDVSQNLTPQTSDN